MPGRGVSGTAVALAGAGGLLVYSGIRGVSLQEALRSVVRSGTLPAGQTGGRIPNSTTGGAPAGALDPPGTIGGSGFGAQFAAAAAVYAGRVPYRWGGETPSGWDCSGFPTYVLVHDLGRTNLPDQTHTVCTQFMVWRGAQTIAGPEPGALVLWPTHMGIALDSQRMVSAVNPSRGTVIDTFRNAGAVPYSDPMFRRVL
jgi:cell wall-associated NlpC family hydrolase